MPKMPLAVARTSAVLLVSVALPISAEASNGTLLLTIKDATTGMPAPARVEVQDANGASFVAADALEFGADCSMGEPDAGPVDQAASLPSFTGKDWFTNPYTNTVQFYTTGKSSVSLPAGPATVTVYKGPEYKVTRASVEISKGEMVQHEIRLKRWIDMPESGWYSADDHLHIARPSPDVNAEVSMQMQAEDVHVANLVQMGKVGNFAIAQQYAHGPESYYQEGNYILAAGQENPRTHFLGHTITLGAAKAHFDPEKYLIYRLIWQDTAAEGAINGYAHSVFPNGSFLSPLDGIAVVAPHDLMHFIEVLQFHRSEYDAWYDLLALGFRVSPTAGTDYPCGGQRLPGHERFYTKVEGSLTYAKWIESVKKGRTFVTTGPMLEFKINGQDIGSEVVLDQASDVDISGSARFDPARDDLVFLELLQNGEVIDRFSRINAASEITFAVKRRVDESSWFALRGYGTRLDENPFPDPIVFGSLKPTTNTHSAPIYVTLKNAPGIEKGAHAKRVARTFMARLDDLERVLAPDNIDYLAAKLADPTIDAVPKEVLLDNRQDLLKEIVVARRYFHRILH
jgi:hypothetical protein